MLSDEKLEIEDRTSKLVIVHRMDGSHVGTFHIESCTQFRRPESQITLVRPPEAVLNWMRDHPDGASGYLAHR
jgi:hypothetical protein